MLEAILLPTLSVLKGYIWVEVEWNVDLEGQKENIHHSSQSPQKV